jgi:hypothetical protein
MAAVGDGRVFERCRGSSLDSSISGDWSVRHVTRLVISEVLTMASPKATRLTTSPAEILEGQCKLSARP